MSKSHAFSNPAFQVQQAPSQANKFNLVTQVNSFNSIFDAKPLDPSEGGLIDKLLIEDLNDGNITKEQAEQDLHQIKLITAEIKAIGRQGTILMGERVYKAREILKSYKDGTFTKWLQITFGSKKTGYNMLSYYELYKELPDNEHKENFKKIPQKAAYILASREGDIQRKATIINTFHHLRAQQFIALIQEEFPNTANSHKKMNLNSHDKWISSFQEALIKLRENKQPLSDENRRALLSVKKEINHILSLREKK